MSCLQPNYLHSFQNTLLYWVGMKLVMGRVLPLLLVPSLPGFHPLLSCKVRGLWDCCGHLIYWPLGNTIQSVLVKYFGVDRICSELVSASEKKCLPQNTTPIPTHSFSLAISSSSTSAVLITVVGRLLFLVSRHGVLGTVSSLVLVVAALFARVVFLEGLEWKRRGVCF